MNKLNELRLDELLDYQYPAQNELLSPWLNTGSVNMMYGPPGIGKTYMALEITYAVATGGKFLSWKAKAPHHVLHIDGETSGAILQKRFAEIHKEKNSPYVNNAKMILFDFPGNFSMPDLSTLEGQKMIDEKITPETKLIVIDNLCSLMRSEKNETDVSRWNCFGDWAIKKRAQGKSIVFIHHAGKDGKQRGTSRKEDFLDIIISLKKPNMSRTFNSHKVEIHFEKTRNLVHISSLAVFMNSETNRWYLEDHAYKTKEKARKMYEKGMSQAQIARLLGVTRQAIYKHIHEV